MCAPSIVVAQLLEIAERTFRRLGSGDTYEDTLCGDPS